MKCKLVYTALRVRNLGVSVAFYTHVLGLSIERRATVPETGGETAVLLAEGGHRLELNRYPEDSPTEGPYRRGSELDHLAFEVEDLRACLAEFAQRGHPVVHGPVETKTVEWAYIEDPDGVWLEIFQRTA